MNIEEEITRYKSEEIERCEKNLLNAEQNAVILRKLENTEWLKGQYIGDPDEIFLRVKREDLPKIRKVLGERLEMSCRVAEGPDKVKVYVNPVSAPNFNFIFTKPFKTGGRCKIVRQTAEAKPYTSYSIVCEPKK